MVLLSFAASACFVLTMQNFTFGNGGHTNTSNWHELSAQGVHKIILWKFSWRKVTKPQKKLIWQPVWLKEKIEVWKVKETPLLTEDKIRGWKVIRTPTWHDVKVPMWIDVQATDMRKIFKPRIRAFSTPVINYVSVPGWRQMLIPKRLREKIVREMYLGTDQRGWEYVTYDPWRRKFIWKPIWKKVWKVVPRQKWIKKKQLVWKEEFQLISTTKRLPIWAIDRKEDSTELIVPVWDVQKESSEPAQSQIMVDVYKLVFVPIWITDKVSDWQKVWRVEMVNVKKPPHSESRRWF